MGERQLGWVNVVDGDEGGWVRDVEKSWWILHEW